MIKQEALKLMGMPGTLRLSENGVWFHDDTVVSNAKIAAYFFKHLGFSSALDSYVIEQNGRCLKVFVADTPQFVRTIDVNDTTASALLTNEQKLDLDLGSLSYRESTARYYASFPDFKACLLKPALQALVPFISENNSVFYCELFGSKFPIAIED